MAARSKIVTVATVPGTGRLSLSHHAVERYIERVRPGLGLLHAVDDLRGLLQRCGRRVDRPAWISDDEDSIDRHGEACEDLWIAVGEDVVFVVVKPDRDIMVVVTCLARGHISDAARLYRGERRRTRAAELRYRRASRRDGRSVRETAVGLQAHQDPAD